jgi:purine-nucleoside/S-methyl-5'-thioadenosine phosphorylase / adenosine deaminase
MIGASTPAEHRARSPAAAALERSLAANDLDWLVADWPAPPDVLALTTTRNSTLDPDAVWKPGALLPSPPVLLKQMHGTNVVVLDRESIDAARRSPPVADAAVTRLPGVVCAVATADCLPVVFADRRGDTIGVAHAGWRGLAAGVLEATVSAMTCEGAAADDLVVWFGPAIGPAVFEVGADVFTAFCAGDSGASACFAPYREGKWLADLYSLARRRLAACGVTDISGGGWCTFSDATRFHSYRRERANGRMLTLVWR